MFCILHILKVFYVSIIVLCIDTVKSLPQDFPFPPVFRIEPHLLEIFPYPNELGAFPGILPDRSNRLEDIYVRFYNGTTFEDYVDLPLSQASRLIEIKGFEKDSPTVLYIHGFIETAQQESVQVVVNSYLEAKPGTNIILLDWSNMSHGSYLVNAARNTKKVGAVAADNINALLEAGLALDNLHIIGHSLGSHVAGYTARELQNKYQKTVKRLTALDPAFPAFYPDGVMMEHVSAKDAQFVDVIHTDAGGYGAPVRTGTVDFWPNGGKSVQPGCPRFAPVPLSEDMPVSAKDAQFVDVIHTDAGGYGAPVRTGTVDFWPNGGKSVQPGCPRFAPVPLSEDNLCSHWRSWRFYAESVRNPEAFPASPADSYHKFRDNPTPENGMIYMGLNCDTSAQGNYYLTTNSSSPFGKGLDGLYPKSKKKPSKNAT